MNLDNYLRPVDAMVFFKASGEILLLSEREADGALQTFRSVNGVSAWKDEWRWKPREIANIAAGKWGPWIEYDVFPIKNGGYSSQLC